MTFRLLLYMSLVAQISLAQNIFHVVPDGKLLEGNAISSKGSINNPWNLQIALNHPKALKPGDTIFLHGGIYNGRFTSKLKGTKDKRITVIPYNSQKVILNGNIKSQQDGVLIVKGPYVDFVDLEITWLGDFSRNQNDPDFQVCAGLVHLSGVDCRFYGLKIHDNPGLGIGFWKHGGASVVENCIIYNNGFISKDGKGRGEGIYVQNKSDQIKYIRNTIIYNNYYKGVEVWSAGKRKDFEFVKNITLDGNIIFNSGSPSPRFVDNVIVASADRNGINIAKKIVLKNNVLYHNTDDGSGKLIGDAASLTLGFNKNAPVEDITVENNIITGGYNGLRFLYVKSMIFSNNHIFSGNFQIGTTVKQYHENWDLKHNIYYTNRKKPFRIPRVKDFSLQSWQKEYKFDNNSSIRPFSAFKDFNETRVIQHKKDKNRFNLAVFSSGRDSVSIDVSKFKSDIGIGDTYKVIDIENPDIILKTAQVSEDLKVEIPMDSKAFQKPLNNDRAIKTLDNFGVFQIEFEKKNKVRQKRSFFKRILDALGI